MAVRLIREMPGAKVSRPLETPNENTAAKVKVRPETGIKHRQYDKLLKKMGYEGMDDPRLRTT